jgi:hypothetical protein
VSRKSYLQRIGVCFVENFLGDKLLVRRSRVFFIGLLNPSRTVHLTHIIGEVQLVVCNVAKEIIESIFIDFFSFKNRDVQFLPEFDEVFFAPNIRGDEFLIPDISEKELSLSSM